MTASLAGGLRHRYFVSLRYAGYRRFLGAQLLSSTGTWIHLAAETWLLARLGAGGLGLGVTVALQFGPILLLGPAGGAVADRFDRRRLLLVTQPLLAAVAAGLALLVHLDAARIWTVWVAAVVTGVLLTVDGPARMAFAAELVDAEHLANSAALANAVAVSARALGPAVSGLLIAGAGVAACFLGNALSYLAVVAVLLGVHRRRTTADPPEPSRRSGLVREGLRHAARDPVLRAVLGMMTVVGVFGLNFQLLITLLATDTFGASARWFGALMSALGVGMVLGSLLSAGWHRPSPGGVAVLAVMTGATHAATGFAPNPWLGLAALAALGTAAGMFLASAAGVLQRRAGDAMRGRVMALYSVAFLGTGVVGGPLIGWVADTAGVTVAYVTGGACCALAVLLAVPAAGPVRTGDGG
ncbi:MFS transporter [Dactylosporangium sp. NPDC050588]|uniref:MFS transporter n=1 Tax=Dactylosporangium sp. NPDC050588 TaxID=3157211 RepID=UPI0033C9EB45